MRMVGTQNINIDTSVEVLSKSQVIIIQIQEDFRLK